MKFVTDTLWLKKLKSIRIKLDWLWQNTRHALWPLRSTPPPSHFHSLSHSLPSFLPWFQDPHRGYSSQVRGPGGDTYDVWWGQLISIELHSLHRDERRGHSMRKRRGRNENNIRSDGQRQVKHAKNRKWFNHRNSWHTFASFQERSDTTGSLSDSPWETGHVNEIRRVMYPGQAKQIQI